VRVGANATPLGAYCPSIAQGVKNKTVPIDVALLLPPHRESLTDVRGSRVSL